LKTSHKQKKRLDKHKIKYKYLSTRYNCSKKINLLSTLPGYKQSKKFILDNALVEGYIPYNDYRKILKAIDKANGEIEFDEEKVSDNTFSGTLE